MGLEISIKMASKVPQIFSQRWSFSNDSQVFPNPFVYPIKNQFFHFLDDSWNNLFKSRFYFETVKMMSQIFSRALLIDQSIENQRIIDQRGSLSPLN